MRPKVRMLLLAALVALWMPAAFRAESIIIDDGGGGVDELRTAAPIHIADTTGTESANATEDEEGLSEDDENPNDEETDDEDDAGDEYDTGDEDDFEDEEPRHPILENATYTLETFVGWFPQSQDSAIADDSDVETWSRWIMESSMEIGEAMVLEYSFFAGLSNLDRERDRLFNRPFSRTRSPSYLDIETLTLTYEADDYAVLIGKALIDVGIGELYSPANVFGRGNFANPLHALDVGVWQLKGQYFIDDDTVSLSVVPYEQSSYLPPVTSRWLGSTPSYDFTRLETQATSVVWDSYHKLDRPDEWGYLLVYEGARESYDFYFALHHGPSAYPVLKAETVDALALAKERPLALTPALGAIRTEGAWQFYGDAVYQRTDEDMDQDFFKYVIGVSYRETEFANQLGLDEIKPVIEYAGETVLDEQNAGGYVVNSFYARPNRDSILARVTIMQDDELTYALGMTRNFTNLSYAYVAGLEYRPTDNLTFHLQATIIGGDTESHLGRWRSNDNIEAGLTYRF